MRESNLYGLPHASGAFLRGFLALPLPVGVPALIGPSWGKFRGED
jgi:hypothetical protein